MKNRSMNFKSKLLAMMLAFVMILSTSAMSICAAAVDANKSATITQSTGSSTTVTAVNSSSVTFNNGIYTININADVLSDMIENKTVSKSDLLKIAPEELVNIALSDGSYSEKAVALARTYLAMALAEGKDIDSIFPLEATVSYFLQVKNPNTGKALIWDIVSPEDLIHAVDADSLFEEIEKSGRLEEVIDSEHLLQILGENGELNAAFFTEILDKLKVSDPTDYNKLINIVADVVFNNDEFDYIIDSVIDYVINDADAFERLTSLIGEQDLAELITDDEQVLLDFYAGLSDEQKNNLTDKVNYTNLQTYLGNLSTSDLQRIIDANLIYTLTESGYISVSDYADEIFTSEFIGRYENILITDEFLTSYTSDIVTDAFISQYASSIITKDFINSHPGLVTEDMLTGFIDSSFISANKAALHNVFKAMINDEVVTITEDEANSLFTNEEIIEIAANKGVLPNQLTADDLKEALLSDKYSAKLTAYIESNIDKFNGISANTVYGYIENDQAAYDLLFNTLMSDSSAIRNILKNTTSSNDTNVINDIFDAIKANDAAYSAIIDNIKGNNALINAIMDNISSSTDPKRNELIEEIASKIDKNHIIDVIINNIDTLQANGTVNVIEIIRELGFANILSNNVIAVNDVILVLGKDYILTSNVVRIENVISAVGGASGLVSGNVIDIHLVINSITNMDAVIAHIDMQEVINECDIQNVIKAIGIQELLKIDGAIDAIDFNKLYDVLPIRTLMSYVDINAVVAKTDKNEALIKAANFLIDFTDVIYLNGTEIYSPVNGFDVNTVYRVLVDAIPTFDTLSDLSDPTALSLVLTWKLDEGQIGYKLPNITLDRDEYTFGFEVKFFGDTDTLERAFAKLASYVSVINDENDTTNVVINLPAKVTALYLKAIDSNKIPSALYNKLLTLGIENVNEETAESILAMLTVDEIITIIENVDLSRIEPLIDKLDGIYATRYDRMLAIAKRAVNAMTIERLHSVASKLNIDLSDANADKIEVVKQKILEYLAVMASEKLISAVENGTFGEYRDLIIEDIDANREVLELGKSYLLRAINKGFSFVGDNIKNSTLSDYYSGNGSFGPVSASASVDVKDKLSALLSGKLPDNVINVLIGNFKNTNVSRTLKLTVNFKNLYEAKFVSPAGETLLITYLPAGADMNSVYALDILQGYVEYGWTYNGSATATEKMPAQDSVFYEAHSSHDYQFSHVVAPTCTEEGYTVYKCTVCQHEDKRDFVPATGHNYGIWILTTEPTINDEGLITRVCANDNSHIETHVLPALNKTDYSYTVVNAPTCTEIGTDKYTYTYSGVSFEIDVPTVATGHSYGEWTLTTTPTINNEGLITRVCANDNSHIETHVLPALNKTDYSYTVVNAPTCTEIGTDKYTYTYSGVSFEIYVSTVATGHNYGEWTLTTTPTINNEGLITRVCANDNSHIETHVLPALNKTDYSYTVVNAPTCTEIGTDKYTYTFGGVSFEIDVPTVATGHSYGEWTLTTTPTINNEGLITRVCANDNSHIETHVLPALNKTDYSYTVVNAPTCTEIGTDKYTYTYGGVSFEIDVPTAATGHNYGEWTLTTTPTINNEGLITRVCANDNSHIETHVLPALNKTDYSYTVVTAPTCNESGTDKYTYTYGGVSFEIDVPTVATGHSYGEWTLTTAPTINNEGLITRVCANDNSHIETHVLPALNKTDYSYTVVNAPTCTENGTDKYTYEIDGASFTFTETTAKLEHNWVVKETVPATPDKEGYIEYICTNCNETYREIIPVLSPSFKTFVDPINGLIVQGMFTEGSVITITPIEFVPEEWDGIINADPSAVKVVTVYEISVDGKYQGPIQLYLPVDESYENGNLKIYHKVSADKFEEFDATISDGIAWVVVDSCSPFAVVDIHNYKETVVPPTCTEKGYTLHTCTNCGDSYTDSFVEATGHILGDWIIDKEPQIGVEGIQHKVCTVCEKIIVQAVIPALTNEDESDNNGGNETETDTDKPVATDEEKSFDWLTVLVLIIALVIILLAVLYLFRNKKDGGDNPPANKAAPKNIKAPKKEAPKTETEKATAPQKVEKPVVTPIVEGPVDAEMADEILSNEKALTAIEEAPEHEEITGKKVAINIGVINSEFEAGETVDLEALKAKKLIPMSAMRVKILADGVIDKPLRVIADEFSIQAVKMITITGGTVIKL